MKLANPALLKTIFSLKRNFSQGLAPTKRIFSGIEVAPFKHNAAAAVCISSDFEMSWAFRGRGKQAAEKKGLAERQNVPAILRLLEEYSIPITASKRLKSSNSGSPGGTTRLTKYPPASRGATPRLP